MKLLIALFALLFPCTLRAQHFEQPFNAWSQVSMSTPKASRMMQTAPVWPALPLSAPGSTQAIARVSSISNMSTKKVIGGGKVVGWWTIQLCSTNGAVSIPVERILMGSTIPFIPNTLAEDIVGRQTADTPSSFISTQGNTILGLGTALATGVGIVAKSPNTIYAAAATSIFQLVVNVATAKAPNATPYFSQLLPSVVSLGSGPASCGTWYIFSSPINGPQVSTWEVKF